MFLLFVVSWKCFKNVELVLFLAGAHYAPKLARY